MKTKLNDLFDQMDEEKGNKIDDKIKLEGDEELTKVIENYTDLLKDMASGYEYRDNLLERKIITGVDSNTITKFSLIIQNITEGSRSYTMGHYLTKLIQKSKDEKHTIILNDEKQEVNTLCKYLRNKIVTINGNVGMQFADRAQNCKIILNGNYLDGCKGFDGEEIYINGSCESAPAFLIRSGKIYISGSFLNPNHDGNKYEKEGKYTVITRNLEYNN